MFLCSSPDCESGFCFKLVKLKFWLSICTLSWQCQKALEWVVAGRTFAVIASGARQTLRSGWVNPVLHLLLTSAYCSNIPVQHFSALKQHHQERLCNESKMSSDVENMPWLKKADLIKCLWLGRSGVNSLWLLACKWGVFVANAAVCACGARVSVTLSSQYQAQVSARRGRRKIQQHLIPGLHQIRWKVASVELPKSLRDFFHGVLCLALSCELSSNVQREEVVTLKLPGECWRDCVQVRINIKILSKQTVLCPVR